MANLKGSRSIPLASKEARNLLSQPGLSIIDHSTGTIEVSHETAAEQMLSLECTQSGIELHSSSRQPQREGELYCQSCCVSLGIREEQLVHYRLDWHRYNLKRRIRGLVSLSQEEFERIAGEDLSSISGSESDSDSNKESEEVKLKLLAMEEEDKETSHNSKPMSSPFLYFSSQGGRCFAVYKNLVINHKAAAVGNSTTSDLLSSLSSLAQPQVWIILMRAGGHFAGAVFRGSAMVVHKTFHRYTVRAKRGTAQSIRDAHQGGHAPRSAGASLRRYNESALVGEIRELISSWSSHVEEATAIFIRTPKYGRGVFVGDGSNYGRGSAPFLKSDPRLKNIPFVTRRPTVKEVQNVHSKLAALYVVSSEEIRHAHSPMMMKQKKQPSGTVKEKETELTTAVLPGGLKRSNEEGVQTPRSDSGDEIEGEVNEVGGATEATTKRKKKRRAKKTTGPQAEVPPHVQRLFKLCRSDANDDSDTLVTELLHEMGLVPINSIVESEVQSLEDKASLGCCCEVTAAEAKSSTNPKDSSSSILNDVWNGETVLHIAAAGGKSSLIPILLLHGANPTIKNKAGHTAYIMAKDKTVRDAFRRFMAQHPTLYDYNAAKVPSPLTEEMERERKEKMSEKKKALKKAKKQREKEHKSEKELKELRLKQENVVSGLSDREKRALAAEKRMATQAPRSSAVLRAGVCSFCEMSLAGVVPFERMQYKYCSMDCLKTHRKQLA